MLGWGLYGARCAQFLFGNHVWKKFVFLQAAVVIVSSVLGTGTVWLLSDIVNGLMAIPNLIALAALRKPLRRLTEEYTSGGTYENFHQRKPLRTFSYAKIPSFGREGKGEG